MLALIRDSNTNSAARRIEGITYTTWREHIQQKPHWRSELAEAEKIRDEVWRDHALEMVKSAIQNPGRVTDSASQSLRGREAGRD